MRIIADNLEKPMTDFVEDASKDWKIVVIAWAAIQLGLVLAMCLLMILLSTDSDEQKRLRCEEQGGVLVRVIDPAHRGNREACANSFIEAGK